MNLIVADTLRLESEFFLKYNAYYITIFQIKPTSILCNVFNGSLQLHYGTSGVLKILSIESSTINKCTPVRITGIQFGIYHTHLCREPFLKVLLFLRYKKNTPKSAGENYMTP